MLEVLAAATKLLLYAGAFTGAGVALAAASLRANVDAVHDRARAIMRTGAGAAGFSSIAVVVVLIYRLGGDFDGETLSVVLQSPTGLAAALQICGAAGMLGLAGTRAVGGLLPAVAGLLMLVSFAVSGHAASFSVPAGIAAGLHVCAAAWWLGAILLLLPASRTLEISAFAQLTAKFSRQALFIVAALIVVGTILVLTLVDFNRPDWFTAYVQVLALKVMAAASVLALAAFNKLRLTPGLTDEDGKSREALRRSMRIEIVLIAGVLAATAILTTYTSPHT